MRIRSHALVTVVATVAALAVAGCGARHEAKPATDASPVTISTVPVLAGGEAALVLPARVTAGEEVVVGARGAGRVTALPYREGDRFRAGATLVAFDAPEAREALGAARAALDAATLRGAQARLQESRMESLFVARVASQRERELAQSDRRDAEAALAAARAGHSQVSASVAIPAPFDGVVVRRMLDPGAAVSAGQPLLAIRSRAQGEIVSSIPESDLGRLPGARFAFRAGASPWRDAVLVRVDGMTDYATRTRTARFRPARHPGPASPLEPGAFAHVRITGGAPGPAGGDSTSMHGILSVPSRSLVRRGALAGVYVVREGRAHLRWLRLGAADGDRVEVLSGLEAGEVIAADPTGLDDGRAVEVAR
jgi:RND family efflux transporter MFP subunit